MAFGHTLLSTEASLPDILSLLAASQADLRTFRRSQGMPKVRLDDGVLWPLQRSAPLNTALVMGWGTRDPLNPGSVELHPRQADVNLYTVQQCQDFYDDAAAVRYRDATAYTHIA